MKRLSTLFWALVLLTIAPVLVYGQDADCLAIVKNALTATNNLCSAIGRNQACYVSSLDAQFQTEAPATLFKKFPPRCLNRLLPGGALAGAMDRGAV